MSAVINLNEKLQRIKQHWTPAVIAAVNDYHVKLVKLQGEFCWHSHADTDELFLVLEGQLKITMRDTEVSLSAGELFVVPKGVEHRPVAREECHVLLLEPAGTLNTGDQQDDLTVAEPEWI